MSLSQIFNKFCKCTIWVQVILTALVCFNFISHSVNGSDNNVQKRLQVRIIGSSTVFPFSDLVQQHFSKKTSFIQPFVVSSGTTAGAIEFCKGSGGYYPDILNASRPMKDKEKALCLKNGVIKISEILIGYDGLVVACSKQNTELTGLSLKELFLAIAEKIYDEKTQTLIPNPYKKWSDISPTLPSIEIKILIPSKKHGTRDAFDELILQQGAKQEPYFAKVHEKSHEEFDKLAKAIRSDGAVREITDYEAADNYYLLFDDALKNPTTLSVIGTNLLDLHSDSMKSLKIDGVEALKSAIQDQSYHLSRKLFMYVKEQNMDTTEGLREFIAEFTSSDAISGANGYLTKVGLVPVHN